LHPQLWKVPLEIHPLMENTDDINAVARDAVEKKMRPRTVFVITGPHLGACASARRACCYRLDMLPELAGIFLRLADAPAAFRVVPDVIEVQLPARRKDIAAVIRPKTEQPAFVQ